MPNFQSGPPVRDAQPILQISSFPNDASWPVFPIRGKVGCSGSLELQRLETVDVHIKAHITKSGYSAR